MRYVNAVDGKPTELGLRLQAAVRRTREAVGVYNAGLAALVKAGCEGETLFLGRKALWDGIVRPTLGGVA